MRKMTTTTAALSILGQLCAFALAGEKDRSAMQNEKDQLAQVGIHWIRKADMPSGAPFPFEHPVVMGDRLYVVHSDAVFSYSPTKDSWIRIAAALPLRRHHYAVAAAAGKLFVIGGCTGDDEGAPHEAVAKVHAFDLGTGVWRESAPMPMPRRNAAAVILGDDVYVLGGNDGSGSAHPILMFDPVNEKWTAKSSTSRTRSCLGAGIAHGKIYMLGLATGDPRGTSDHRLEEYDPEADTLVARAPLTPSRGGYAVAALDDLIYVLAGRDEQGHRADLDRYDPLTDSWEKLPDLPVARSWPGAVAFDGGLWILGGVSRVWESPDATIEVMRPGAPMP
jgi:N-acetylneuraminic acid mutarotase